jgi:hypothetical protein
MRLIAYVLAALIVSGSGPAAAQWMEYAYIAEGFAVAFPAEPQVEEVAMYQIIPGKSIPARVYSTRYNNGLFKVTVADGRDAGLQEAPIIDYAVKQMTQGGEVKIDFPHRIYRIYGRQLSIARPDGSLTTAAVFFANERLYQIESTRFPGGTDTDLIRFQQSLTFDRNVPNRTPQQMQAIRAACTRGVAGNDAPGNPAGVDDPRCAQE